MIEVEVHDLVIDDLSLVLGGDVVRAQDDVLGPHGEQGPEATGERKSTGIHDDGSAASQGVPVAEGERIYGPPKFQTPQQVATPAP